MSFLSDFEGRIGSVFGAAPQGYTEPFSFKKLAKQAAREMENETYEIDGVDTAPALYTVLVSSTDDALMRPLYGQITYETSAFVTSQAQKKGYAFVGSPLVRFMVDPSLKSGKFTVFAENVDVATLERLREEERAFLGGNSSVGGAAAQIHRKAPAPAPAAAPAPAPAPAPISAVPSPALEPLSDADAGFSAMPVDYAEPMPVASASESTPMPVPLAGVGAAGAEAAIPIPQTQRRNVPLVDMRRGVGADVVAGVAGAGMAGAAVAGAASAVPGMAAAPAAQAPQVATALLIDRATGQTYPIAAPSAIIGRERSQAHAVLHDPNVSRRHAELFFDGSDWHIRDLNSTNGTLVNDVSVSECTLRDGDLITVGLVNLEFRGTLR